MIKVLAVVGCSKRRAAAAEAADGGRHPVEDTFRQENQSASINSCLLMAEPAAARLTAGALRITVPFLTKAR